MKEDDDPHPAKWFNLQMMVALGGRERTDEEFRKLFSQAGFELTKIVPLPAPFAIVEAVPA